MWEWCFLIVAGLAAGVIGTAGGITSLVAYLALLATGIPPLAANVTNAVALLGSGSGSVLRAGPDIAGHGQTLREWIAVTIVFSLGGAVLLILTPAGVFDDVVPFLVAIGSLGLLCQPVIASRLSLRGAHLGRAPVLFFAGGIAIYNGYFGAGSGILMLTLVLLSIEPVLHRANAIKNVVLASSDVLPAVLFAALGPVVWHAVWPLGIGAFAGGLIGPTVARTVPAHIMRGLIGVCGLAFAVWLAFNR
jgi:uncharacterized protein